MALRDPAILDRTLSVAERAVLSDLVARLKTRFGDRLVRLAVFGSRARGDVREDSDIDILIVLRVEEQEEDAAADAVWADIRESKRAAPRHFVPVSPAIFSEARFERILRRERRFALDAVAEGITL